MRREWNPKYLRLTLHCGASSGEKQLGQEQNDFYAELTREASTTFGESQSILAALTKSFKPVLDAGINQKGFSEGELTNLESQATTGTGANYSKAAGALAKVQGAAGGGSTYIPTGAKMQQQEELATSAAENESGIQSNIISADYATGRENYLEAANVLGGVAGQYNPTGFNNSATGAGSAASTTQNNITNADNSWMQLVSGAIGAAGSVGAAYCPAKDSLYLMSDGSEKLVQELQVGDLLSGIDGSQQRIEEIQTATLPVLKITTENGMVGRSSRVHAFALPLGGFVVAMHSLDKTIVTANGPSKVISVNWDGNDEVFNVITDGSHTYRADGIWALGVGEAERHVAMEEWGRIGDRIASL